MKMVPTRVRYFSAVKLVHGYSQYLWNWRLPRHPIALMSPDKPTNMQILFHACPHPCMYTRLPRKFSKHFASVLPLSPRELRQRDGFVV